MLKTLSRTTPCWRTKHAPSRSFIAGLENRIGFLGVPFGMGQKKEGEYRTGLEAAPDTLRGDGILMELKALGHDVKDYGNLAYSPNKPTAPFKMNNLEHVAPVNKELSATVQTILKDKRMSLMVGGDHSLGIGSIAGHIAAAGEDDVAVVYVDAHSDINTNGTTESGNIHGMTVALLARELRHAWPTVPGFEWLQPRLSLNNVAFIGLRSVDPWESYFLQRHNVPAYHMDSVHKYGIHHVIDMALRRIDPHGTKSIHLSFDVDSMDYLEAPCTTVPVRGGLLLREAVDIAERLRATRRLDAVDLVELNPLLGTAEQCRLTLDAVKHVLLSSFGYLRRGNHDFKADPPVYSAN